MDAPSPAELRAEIDRLRLENQRLRVRLAEAAGAAGEATPSGGRAPRASLGAVAARAVGAVLRRVRRMRRRLGGAGAARATPAASIAPDVQPYRVRPRHAPAAARARVLHVIANFHLGGSSRLVVDIVEHLGHRYDQAVVSWDLPPSPAYAGLDVVRHDGFSTAEAARVLAERRPDLLHVHYLAHHRDEYSSRAWEWYRHWFAAAERLGIPVVENVNIPTEPYVSDAVRCYVHVSDHVRLRFGRDDGRHVTIYPGSDLDRFARPADAPRADDCIGMTYRLQGDKLDARAIEPFIEVVRRRPGTRALVVGGGSFLEPYRARVAAAGLADAFTFTGYVAYEELPRLYAQMSVFVAPVHRESFGQVSPFAMGMELPVAGYRVGALEEITGDPSLLAPPGDVARLADIIVGLLDDPERRRTIGAANRRRAVSRFSVEAMIAGYAALYQELIPGVPAAASGRPAAAVRA